MINSYILNRGWIDKSQKKSAAFQEIVREDDLDELEKSEDELDAAEEFESKYNFRFEDAYVFLSLIIIYMWDCYCAQC